MDTYLTACTGLDAMAHAIEAYVRSASSRLTDLHALEAIRLIHDHLPEAVDGLTICRPRGQVMLGQPAGRSGLFQCQPRGDARHGA